jgi:hypothetical protein
MDSDHRKDKFHEILKEKITSEVIDTDQIVALDEASMNLMSQQAMILFKNHNHTFSQSLDYKLVRSITLKQNYTNLMTKHKTKEICSVHNIESSNLELSS